MENNKELLKLPPKDHDYKIFNSHCHLNDDSEYKDFVSIIKKANEFNVSNFIVVGSDQKLNERALNISDINDKCIAAIGWHPESWKEYNNDKLINLLNDLSKKVLIGEIGLDYHYENPNKEQQQRVFIEQIEVAKQYGLPISIHTRDAFDDTISILKEHQVSNAVIHNFNTNSDQAYQYLELGLYLSVSGVVTFKNAQELRDSIKDIPKDRLLIETDDPYLTPVPFRGKPNTPGYAYFVIKKISDLLNISIKDLAKQTFENTEILINGK